MFTIGEFSRITGLTVKTLRFYHDEGLLVPCRVDPQTSYRFYDAGQLERARVITWLREMEIPIAEIRQIVTGDDETGILDILEWQRFELQRRISQYRNIVKSLEQFITSERQAQAMASGTEFAVEEKTIEPMLIAGIRMKGKYSECGKGFGRIGRSFGRYLAGQPMLLHHDGEYREVADFEACIPLRQGASRNVEGIAVRELPGGRCVTLVHKGPYEQLSHSYSRIMEYIKQKGYTVTLPTREVYLKGPGMILKGNPKNYLTEIQMPIG